MVKDNRFMGCKTDDRRYRFQKTGKDHRIHTHPEEWSTKKPLKLNARRRALVIKTRNKLERDSWCWAINNEIERLSRSNAKREEAARYADGIIQLQS